jgi:archaellin
LAQANFRRTAKAKVTAGFRWAPLTPPATQMAKATAKHQPQVISSQSPAASKIVVGLEVRPEPGSPATATATTPSPNARMMNVPRNSAMSSPHSPVMRP